MTANTLKFTLLFVAILGSSYILQVYLFQPELAAKQLYLVKYSYLFNFTFTYVLMLNIFIFKKLLEDKLGFVFLGISMLKFVIFYFAVKSKNIEINKSDFLLFFIPFVLCLAIEIFYISKILNRVNYYKDK